MTSRRLFLLTVTAWPLAARTKKFCGVRFRIVSRGRSNRRYLWIHGDETTARDVLDAHLKTWKGKALFVQNETRLINAGTMTFDPNRMFTAEGLERNLRRLHPEATDADRARIHKLVARDREKLLRELTPPKGGLLTVMHNNSRGYSVKDEVEISNEVSLPMPDSPNDFMLCTDPADFAILKRSPFNVVLQNAPKGEDDGSFSRLAAARKIRYLNIESAIGRAEPQRAMLEWAEKNLP